MIGHTCTAAFRVPDVIVSGMPVFGVRCVCLHAQAGRMRLLASRKTLVATACTIDNQHLILCLNCLAHGIIGPPVVA